MGTILVSKVLLCLLTLCSEKNKAQKEEGKKRIACNGNYIIDNMYPNRFESAGMLRNSENMGHPQLVTPIQEYNP